MIEFNRSQRHHCLAAQTDESVKIKIVGIGGAGSNALDRIVLDGAASARGAEIVVMNTDVQALTSSVANDKVQLGRIATRGLGAGGDPELGQQAAEECADEIARALDGAGMVFLCVGLGGGTGSGAAPLVASIAKDQGAVVIVFATVPFSFEGKRRARQADEALVTLQTAADAVICFENDTIGDAISPNAGIHQAFAAADETISQSVHALAGLFTRPGILHIGFDDLRAALRTSGGGAGRCLFGYGETEGDNRAYEALTRALKSPLMDRGRMLEEAHNVLVNVSGGAEMTLNEVQILMTELSKHIGEETQVFFGASVDPRMGERMSVTIISSMHIGPSALEISSVASAASTVKPVAEPQPPKRHAEFSARQAQTSKRDETAVEEISTYRERGENRESHDNSYEDHANSSAASVDEKPSADFIEEDFDSEKPDEQPQHHEPFIDIAPAASAQAETESQPMQIPAPRKESLLPKAKAPEPSAVPSPMAAQQSQAQPKPREERQETLQFEPVTRGRFEKSEPTIIDGQDLDVPTFLRRNIRVK